MNAHIQGQEMETMNTNALSKNMKQGNIQDRKKMEWGMGLENLFIIKEVYMRVIGKIIWCMEKEIFITQMEK